MADPQATPISGPAISIIEGPLVRLPHHVNTDQIYPGRYLSVRSHDEMARHAFENLESEIRSRIEPGAIIVAGRNFGCGSSRSQAVTGPKYAGIRAIVAVSFARVYFRNCINQGLPVIVCPEAYELLREGERARIDLVGGSIETGASILRFTPLPDFLLEILSEGGLVPYTRRILAGETRGGK
jgi:3-isopropylmalate/(R)-2-methylmalate dehydratase small subunit